MMCAAGYLRDGDRIDYAQGMEGAFFSWGDFSFRYSVLVFRDCTTKVALGRIPAGVYVPKIELDLVHGEMALFRSSSEPADVVLRIGFCLL